MKRLFYFLTPILMIACKKEQSVNNNTPNLPESRLVKIEYDDTIDEIKYQADGKVASIITKEKANNSSSTQTFYYNNGQISKIDFDGAAVNYQYPNNNTVRLELDLFGSGTPNYRFFFHKADGKLNEFTQFSLGTGLPVPEHRSVYTYNSDGNIIKEEVYEHNGAAWVKLEDIFITYDNKPNTSARFDFMPFYLQENVLKNNPLTITRKGLNGAVIETTTYSYTYDSRGRKTRASVLHQTGGQPDERETILYSYE